MFFMIGLVMTVVLGVALGMVQTIDAAEEIAIWEGDAPGTEGRENEEEVVNERVRKVHQPSLTVHLPPRELATGSAVLVCPGGGYHHLAIYKEGHQIADWLNTLGMAAFVLKYRLNRDEALQDAQRAMRVIRAGAENWGVDGGHVGVMGFSAGGHLITNLVMHSDAGDSNAADAIEQMSSRPDFMMPIYVSVKTLNVEDGIGAEAPKAFLVGASDDTTTPPENSIRLYQALLKAGVPVELHLYERGGHGFGLAKAKGPVKSWTVRCEDWMRLHQLID